MNPPAATPTASRRKLLGSLAGTSAAVAAAAVLPTAVARAAVVTPQPARSGPRGYQDSEHVRRYYQLARF